MASTNATAPSPASSSPPPSQASPPPAKSPPAPPPQSPPPSPPPRSPPPPSPAGPSDESPDAPPPSNKSSPPSPSSSSSSSRSSAPPKSNDVDSPPVPPSSSRKSPPFPKSLTKSPASHTPSKLNDDSDELQSNLPLIMGATIGVGVFLILLLISSLVLFCRKKKQKHHAPVSYYDALPGLNKGGYYNGGPVHKWQNGNPNMEQMGRISIPPGAMLPHGGGWHQTPHPQAMLSSGMSLEVFSGPHGAPLAPPSPSVSLGFSKSIFTFEELSAATNGFSQDNLLGQGGFGYVHKGVLPNGKEVAVKQLKSGSGQGEREFKAEVEIISRVHHRHLVSLVGYSIAGQKRMLVYEFVPNKTLEYHLHGKGLPTMDWPARLKIALGSAKGLAYLHEDCHPRIIHRDIKTANILLDNKFEAMVADFGLAKLTNDANTHVSTRVMGTFGYLAPEYASSGKLTEKSDVFSFGVMLLELITGRRPVDNTHTMEDSLVDWARPILTQALTDENFGELVDPRLERNYDPTEMARMISSAAACVRHSAKRRPNMSQIVRSLEGDMSLEHLNEGIKPGESMLFSSGSEYDSGTYTSNMRQFRRAGLDSDDYTYGYSAGITSEYELDPSDSSSSGEMKSSGKQSIRNYSDD